MKYILLILLLSCGTEPTCKADDCGTYTFNEVVEDSSSGDEKQPEPSSTPAPEEIPPSVTVKSPGQGYDTQRFYLDPVANSYWIVGPAIAEYAGGYPCGIEGNWWMPYKAELRAASLRGLANWASDKGASLVGLVSDGYSACSVRNCEGVDTLSIYCVLREEFHSYEDVPWIIGQVQHLCDTPDLAEEDYCE